jgi:acyl carrier protein
MSGVSRSSESGDRRHRPRQLHTTLAADLRDFLSQRLPGFMVPDVIIELDRLPLTPNRKVDRSALPDPVWMDVGGTSTGDPPVDEREATVAAAWREVLGRDDVGVGDNFFRLGGNSLAVMRILAKLHTVYGVRLSVQDFFHDPTIRALARRLEAVADG